MQKLLHGLLFILLAMMTLPAFSNNDSDDDSRRTVCERSASKMFKSCRFEVQEELYATTAKCINQVDPDDPSKASCLQTARAAYFEDRAACADQKEARAEACELLDEDVYGPDNLLTGDFVAEPDASNPYFSLAPGHTYTARAGQDYEELIFVTVTEEVREVLGVNCRLVVDIVLIREGDEYVPVEATDDYYAQAYPSNDVHYCGETARNFEDGLLVDLDGSFEAGRDLAKSGILIKAEPMTEDAHRQEYLLGEAEDIVQYVAGSDDTTDVGYGEGGDNPNFPCNGDCVKTREFIPPEPDAGEYKYYLAGSGFVLGVALEDGEPTGERDEVLCRGNSIDGVLGNPVCGVPTEDLEEVRDILCGLSSAFCE